MEDLIKAAGVNCLLWGGMYNPIIPIIKGENTFAEQLLKLFSVDVLYAVSESQEINTLIQKYRLLTDPGRYAQNIFYEDWYTKKQISGYLDSKNIIDYLWDKEFKHKPMEFKSAFSLFDWKDNDPLSNVFSVQFGFFPKQSDLNLKYDYKDLFLKGLRGKEQSIPLTGPISVNAFKSISPIQATGVELRGFSRGASYNGNGIYLGMANEFEDLLTFWNLRSSGINVGYVALDSMERCETFGQSYLDELNKLPNSHPNIEDRIIIYHRIEYNEIDKELIKRFNSKKQLVRSHIKEISWNGLNVQPADQVFSWEQTSVEVEKQANRYRASIRLPNKPFLVDQDQDRGSKYLGVIVDAYGEYEYPGYTLSPPYIRELSEFYGREIALTPLKFRIGREGITFLITERENSVLVYPLSIHGLIEKLFEIVGLTAKTSQAGLIARRIIEKIGGIDGARVFKIKGARMLLQEGGRDKFVTGNDAIGIIKKHNFEKHKRLYIEPRDAPDLTGAHVFDFLLKKGFLRAGLQFLCHHCRLKQWQSLKEIDDTWYCEFCGGENQTSLHLRGKSGNWMYRKSGLFAKSNHQEGAIPVLLTLLCFYRIISSLSEFRYSTALEIKGDVPDCETDFFVINTRGQKKIEIGFGECKSDGGIIDIEDCEKMKSIYKKLNSIEGVRTYITFGKTANSFSPNETILFKRLNNEGIPTILFTNRELEPYDPYWSDFGEIENDIPIKYPNSLLDLSRNSIARYLSQP